MTATKRPAVPKITHYYFITLVVNFAFVNATLVSAAGAVFFRLLNSRQITSVLHLQTAVYQAILAACHGSLRTKTVHSEVLWALNPTNNVRIVVFW